MYEESDCGLSDVRSPPLAFLLVVVLPAVEGHVVGHVVQRADHVLDLTHVGHPGHAHQVVPGRIAAGHPAEVLRRGHVLASERPVEASVRRRAARTGAQATSAPTRRVRIRRLEHGGKVRLRTNPRLKKGYNRNITVPQMRL